MEDSCHRVSLTRDTNQRVCDITALVTVGGTKAGCSVISALRRVRTWSRMTKFERTFSSWGKWKSQGKQQLFLKSQGEIMNFLQEKLAKCRKVVREEE